MNWFDSLQAFVKTSDLHSFAAAARELNLPRSVVSKRIQWLEDKLGCSLLVRTTRNVTLSDEGNFLLIKVKPLLLEWDDVYNQMLEYKHHPQGTLTISLAPGLSGLSLMNEVIHTFAATYPDIEIQITTIHNPIKMSELNTDIVIATDKYIRDAGQVSAITLHEFNYSCYASENFIKKHGSPKTPADLKNFNCIMYQEETSWEFNKKNHKTRCAIRVDSGEAAIGSCLADCGLIYVPSFFVSMNKFNKKLIQIFPTHEGKKDTLKLYYVKKQYKPRKIECFQKVIQKIFV